MSGFLCFIVYNPPGAQVKDMGVGATIGTPASCSLGASVYGDLSYTWIQGTTHRELYDMLTSSVIDRFGQTPDDFGISIDDMINKMTTQME